MSGELPGLNGRPCMVGFAQIPAQLYTAVSARARDLWGVLDIHQGGRAHTYPSHEHLAEDLGWSVDTVRRALRELSKAKWLEVEVARGRGNSNRYKVRGRAGKRGNSAPFSVVDNDEKQGSAAPFSSVDNQEKGADLPSEKGADLPPLTRGIEPESGGTSTNSTTERAREPVDKCEHGRPLAADDRTPTCSVCAEQRQLWPTAVGQ